ncbi:MAG: HD domain-containing phosphohydrolase [Nitrospirota bacterium]
MIENGLLTLYEVAKILRVKPLTIHRMLHRDELKGTKIGRDWRFEKSEPERYLKEQESKGHFVIGMKFKAVNNLNKAIDCFKEATKAYPQNKKAHLELGKIYFDKREEDKIFYTWAKQRLEKVLNLDPENAEAFSLLEKINSTSLLETTNIFEERINQLSDFAKANFDKTIFDKAIFVKNIDKEHNKVSLNEASFNEASLHDFPEHIHHTVKTLSEMVNDIDAYSKGHSEKKAIYASAIGQRLGIPYQQLEIIQMSAFLYDIGKIKIDKEILLKPGRLTQEELEVMKQHPRLGADILKEAGLPNEISSSALSHHESYDGKGYPHGLSGEEIPLIARIIKAVDTFGALVSERPYRKSLSFDESINELKRLSGSELDSNVVNTFLDVLSENKDWIFKGEHIRKKFPIRRILIVNDDPWTAKAIKGSLELEGFGAITAQTGEDALQKIYESPPDLIITEILLPDINGYELCKRLSRETRSSHIPIITITTNSDIGEEIKVLESGADIYMVKPFNLRELVARVKALLRRVEQERAVSPLTGLPGTVSIEEEIIKRVLNHDEKFEVMYLDIDNFKTFNDVYGFLQGDEAIKLTAKILLESFENSGSKSDFIGHIGGDDFIAITTPERADNLCRKIISQFDLRIKDLYQEEDIKRGYIIKNSRNGEEEKFPILTLSIGCVNNSKRKIASYWEVGEIATEVKEYAKSRQGSSYHRDVRAFEGVKI